MYENIDFDNIDLTQNPPQEEPDRQYYYIAKARQYVQEKSRKKGRPLTFCVNTFGCQMNARDSEKLIGILEQIGYVKKETEDADFVIYNTCTVRENANNKVYKFAELIVAAFESKGMIVDIWKDTDKIVEDLPVERKYTFKSGVNIMFGCNNFCSYCIVPYVRGRERSRDSKDIIREIERLVADGVVEVMLLGQNVNSYGKNLEHPMTFAQLLEEVEKIDGLERIRFMTSHPKDLSDELIEVLGKSKKICKHLHLPLQSGSSRILKEMNRHYTKEQYLELVKKIRAAVPDIALTTDIIVGFPGETEEDFLETMEVVKEVQYDSAFTFIYSKRTGTPAATKEDQVSPEVVKDRFDRLLHVVQEIGSQKAGALQGTVQKVLIEEINAQDEHLVTGRLSNNSVVHVPGGADLIGKIVNVSLDECKGFYYLGTLAEGR